MSGMLLLFAGVWSVVSAAEFNLTDLSNGALTPTASWQPAVSSAGINYVALSNGVLMPTLSLQPEQYPADRIGGIVKDALNAGIRSIDTGAHSTCQQQVADALDGLERSSFFVTSAILPDANTTVASAYAAAASSLESILSRLRLSQVDLMLLSRPAARCDVMQEEWRALEDFYASGKARAIGVRVYCPSSLTCLMQTAKRAPMLNQIFFHVGMGPDPDGFISAFKAVGAVTQSIRVLASGDKELISGEVVTKIGRKHNWSGAQVSMRWVLDHGVPLSLATSSRSHMEEAAAILEGPGLSSDESNTLDGATTPHDSPSFWCTPSETVLV
eukprot:TRINITY_DN54084_c0_g1_i1.p1 TRINITY_DN54084_c0_g1~~TRINITY_DN54084_c0_g1_i1.p1  ORF type:complete len:355 (-),score=26.22 TRINITY_DN54084_c0_g1_i1:98-1084(-)